MTQNHSDRDTGKKLNGEAKVLFEGLSRQREEDKRENTEWKKEHNRSSKEFRDEIKQAISDIWRAMREGFDKMSEALIKTAGTGTDWKMISIMISICLLIVTLLGARIISLENGLKEFKMENRLAHTSLLSDFQNDIELLRNEDLAHTDVNRKEISRIRDWKDLVERNQGAVDAKQNSEIENIRILLDTKAADRFTGSEGRMMQKQIDRLEERLSFLTKQQIENKTSSN